ncbi:MAG: IS630 family transposase [Candidatus Moeniiplasma glomeromycotorum]|nr:IS630 family transposase [Candidatus Moeniiplasma glomeromycotorum]
MEYLAKIIKGERSPNKQLWRYTFLDLKTSETDWFINNHRISYIPDLVGKLELIWDKTERYKIYQSFTQDIVNLTEEEEEILFYSQDKTDLDTKRIAKNLIRKKRAELTTRQIVKLRKNNLSWGWISDFYEVSKRDIRRKRNPKNIKDLQKAGRKRKIDRKTLYYLLSYLSKKKATLKKMSDYLYKEPEVNQRFSISTIFLALKRIKYSWQVISYRNPRRKSNFMEVIEFIEKVNELPPRQLLATDESGYPLNLAPQRAWGLKGEKIVSYKSRWGKNYSLILVIRNVKKGGIIYWELIEETVNTDAFHNFLSNINLPANEKYYLLMDRVAFHKAEKVNELLKKKNIEPRLIVASNPWLNPTELVFNVIKQYVKSQEPETEKGLRSVISEKIVELQEEGMTKFFKECLNYDFIFKSGQ